MKKLSFLYVLTMIAFGVNAQGNYTEAIKQGDVAFKKGEYKTAINKYFAAEAFDPSQKEIVKARVKDVFDKVETLRQEAQNAKIAAIKLEKKATLEAAYAREQELIVKREKEKNDTIISRMGFVNNRCWVFNKELKCALIDENGKLITDYKYINPSYFLSPSIFSAYDESGFQYIFDSNGNILLQANYFELSNNNSFFVRRNELCTIIPANIDWKNVDDLNWYSSIGVFNNGYAISEKNGKFYYIDPQGRLMNNEIYDEAFDFHEGLAWARSGNSWIIIDIRTPVDTLLRNEKYIQSRLYIKYYNVSSKRIVISKENGIETHRDTIIYKTFSQVQDFNNGSAWVKLTEKNLWGKLHVEGEYVVPPKYDSIEFITPEFTKIIENKKLGIINQKNQIIIPPIYDNIEFWNDTIFRVFKNNKIGCIDKYGTLLFNPAFDKVYNFSDSLFLINSNGKYGWTDINGNVVIDTIFTGGYIFEKGKSVAYLNQGAFIIDKAGRLLHKLLCENTKLFSEGVLWINRDNLWGLVDTSGNELIPPTFSDVQNFKGNYAWVKQFGAWGLITKNEYPKYKLPPIFSNILDTDNQNEFWVEVAGAWGCIQKNGEWKVNPKFDTVYKDLYGNMIGQIMQDYFLLDEDGRINIK